jgi:hypothetical protein
MQKSLQEKMVGGGPANIVLTKKSIKNIEIIKVKFVQIENIFKGTLASEKKALDEKKRRESNTRREKQEEKLETKPNAEKGSVKMPASPRMGILDWIKNFIGNILLGYFAVRLIDHLPKIMPIVKFLGNAADFIIDVGGKLLNGLVTFIDWGYKAYDATRGFIKGLGGENFAQGFDKFVGAIDTTLFLATAIAGDLLLESLSGDGGGGLGDIVGDQLKKRGAQKVATSVAGKAGTAAKAGGVGAAAAAAIVAGAGLLASALGEGAFQLRKFAVKPIQKLEDDQKNDKNPLTRFGRGVVLNMVRPLFGLFQTVGFLLDVVGAPFRYAIELLRYPFLSEEDKIKQANNLAKFDARIREDLRKALNMLTLGLAFKEKGSFGNIYGNKGSQKQMMGKMAGGGITRGGRSQTGARRTIGGTKKKGQYKRALAQKPSKIEIKTEDKTLKETGEQLDKTKYFGPILAISSKIMAKQEPTQKDYENVGLGINLLISKGIEEDQLKGGLVAAFAGGGLVDDEFLEAAEKGSDITNWVARTFKGEIESNAQKTLRLIREKIDEKKGPAGVSGPGQPGSPDMINIQGGDVDFWTLVAVASREDGDPQAWADVAQSIYNRLASGAYTGKTIKDLILGQMQYEPTWKFPKPGVTGKPNQEWYSIKDAASAGIAAGQSEGAMKKVAAAILDPTLQKNAREFIQGRTDFRGYSVSGGAQRKSGDNYFGWYNNYRANKVGSVPNFGATATTGGSGPGGSFVGGGTGSGYGTGGVKIAGDLGDYMKANRGKIGVTGDIHQHPRHPKQEKRNYFSYHNQNRALDIGGYGPAHPSSGGRDEQAPVIRALLEWNKRNGYQPVEIIHGSPAFKGLGKYESGPRDLHSNHVHVAYHRGKVRSGKETIARILKDEKVLDPDTSKALDQINPLLAYQLNKASTKEGVLKVLQSYAGYELPYAEPQIIEVPVEVSSGDMGDYSSSSAGESRFIPIFSENDSFESLYVGG